MKLINKKIIYLILVSIFAVANLKSQDLPSIDNLPEKIKNEISGLNEIEQIKKLQDICWDLRFTNSIDALKAGRVSVDMAKKLNDYESIAKGLSFIGVIYLHISDYTSANNFFLQALEISETHDLKLQLGYSYNNLSHLFNYMNNIEKAYENIWKSKLIMEEINDKRGLAYAYLRLSDLYLSTKNWDSAYYYAIRTVEIRKELGNKKAIGRAMLNVGESLEGMGQYKKALDIYMSIMDDIEEIGKIEIYIANAYYNLENYNKAIEFAEIAYNKTVSLSLYQQLFDATKVLFKAHKSLNNLNTAMNYAELRYNYRDSIFTFERDRQISILNYTYELDKKEKANQELTSRGQEKDRFIYISSITLILLLVGSIFLFISRRKIKNINNLLNEKNIEIQRQSDELHELNATKDKFFSIIAHDLKNPIGSFKNLTDFFKDYFEELDLEEKLDLVKTLSESSNQVYNLLENLLEWSRIQRGSISYNPQDFDLHYVVDKSIQLLKTAASQKKISLNNQIPKNTIIEADGNMITTIVRNLLSNSIKFTKENGTINIKVISYETESVIVSVEDNGIGMTPETLNKLFRIDSNHTTLGTANEKGTGLGLILCKEFVEKNKGKMWAESELNNGSRFNFSLIKGNITN